MKYILATFLSLGLFAETEKVFEARVYIFENNFYLEVEDHFYFIEELTHSVNCPCMKK
jgi:hypothetical protein